MRDPKLRSNAQSPPPLQPDEDQHHKKSDSKWDSNQSPSAEKQPTTTPFHSQHENRGGQESLVQPLVDLSLQGRPTTPSAPNTTCIRWMTKGSCTSTNCRFAHHLFPRVIYRAHRGGNKSQDCEFVRSGAECWKAEEMCGYSHEMITPEVRQKQKQMVDRIKDQEQDWKVKLTLKCQKCSFSVDGSIWDNATEHMINHCQKKHPPAAETASRSTLSPTADPFTTIQYS